MAYYNWVIAVIAVGSLTGAILAVAYAIKQRRNRSLQQMYAALVQERLAASAPIVGCRKARE